MHRCGLITAPLRYEAVDLVPPRWPCDDEQGLLRMSYVGLCGSDRLVYEGRMPLSQVYPRVPGHEAVGLAEDSRGHEQLVVVNPYQDCGHCAACQHGLPNACIENRTYGVQRDGLLRTALPVARARLYPVWDLGAQNYLWALAEPTAVAIHLIRQLGYAPRERVLVAGVGNIGRLLILLLSLRIGPCEVVALVRDAGQAEQALRLGAHQARLYEPGLRLEGFDVAFETAGTLSALTTCYQSVRPGGVVALLGHTAQPLALHGRELVFRELTLVGSRNAVAADFREALQFIKANPEKFDRIVGGFWELETAGAAFTPEHWRKGKQIVRL